MAKAPRAGKKKLKKNVPVGVAHIQSTFNNTVVTLTDLRGNTISWCSAGVKGFKGSKKSTPFAATQAAEDAARKGMDNDMQSGTVLISGPGAGREAAIRALSSAGLKVTLIRDIMPIPHNGCHPKKRRRV